MFLVMGVQGFSQKKNVERLYVSSKRAHKSGGMIPQENFKNRCLEIISGMTYILIHCQHVNITKYSE